MVCIASLLTRSVGGGGAYALIGVKSSAPPFAALLDLLGLLVGEHALALLHLAKP